MSMEKLNAMNGTPCACGKEHRFTADVIIGKGVVAQIPDYVKKYGGTKVFVLSDVNTCTAAGEKVSNILQKSGIAFSAYTFPQENLEPDEASVGSAVMHYDTSCDMIVAVGSGVINDIGKILSNMTGRPYMIVGTAPSMDGYASASSSMTRDGLKISLPSRSADVIIGDTDILCQAPLHMMKAGLGDMLAKYVSICEWRISHLITGEYYCEEVAQLIRSALKRCADNAEGLLQRNERAVQAVFEGLVIGGVAMNYAGLSRPASGVEHYISHVLDMRGVEFGTPVELHGIQLGVGTSLTFKIYDRLRNITPSRETAEKAMAEFDPAAWEERMHRIFGKAAQTLIDKEKAIWHKNDPAEHQKRMDIILANWDQIMKIADEELPPTADIVALMEKQGMPIHPADIDEDEKDTYDAFVASRDIRDKYLTSSMLWDIGLLENFPLDL